MIRNDHLNKNNYNNGVIDQGEFINSLTTIQSISAQKVIDLNGDGQLSLTELRHVASLGNTSSVAEAAKIITSPNNIAQLSAVSAGRKNADGDLVLLPQDIKSYIASDLSGQVNTAHNSYKQGLIGDCWVLSSMGALLNSDSSADLANSVKSNLDGSYSVKLPGIRETITISAEQLSAVQNHAEQAISTQNLPMAAMEMVLSQYWQKIHNKNIGDGGSLQDVATLLNTITGKQANVYDAASGLNSLLKSPNQAAIFGSGVDDKGNCVAIDAPQSKGGHAFFIKNVNANNSTVTYTNPWDTSVTRTMPVDYFVKNVVGVAVV